MINCRICGKENEGPTYKVREMQLGTEEEFEYFQCSNCECLQIKDFPPSLDNYYPKDYYSFNQYPLFKTNIISKFLSKNRTRFNLFNKGLIGRILALIHPNELLKTIGESGINANSSVLDIGCGRGHTLYTMSVSGMKNLLGIDPYLEKDIQYENGLNILKKSVDEIHQQFDFIMLNHVFEHIQDQRKMLIDIYSLLKPKGICLIRIPTCSSHAWEHYKNYWVQLDAPRHLFIHSIKSIGYLVNECGFQIEKIKYDSEAFQFLGSEQYLKKIPLNAENSFFVNREKSIFTDSDFKEYKKRAKKLNADLKGDQIAVFIKKM